MNKILFLLVVVLFSSCHFFGPIDSSIQTKNVKLKQEDLVGKWKLDKFSYKYLTKKVHLDSIAITFNTDSTFVLNNSKNLFRIRQSSFSHDDVTEIGVLDNLVSKGKWDIYEYGNNTSSSINLNFQNEGTNINLNVFKKDEDYQLWFFQSDPDTGYRLRFLKHN
ncbi:hypothetical protein ACFS5J_04725 [Flavobacterium chuncheonense]|uniref:Lipocalin-like domain-containing protein n=1 Tax=Flavobacterium chuncheonense TaxID=2026653 RepID=A0ABW5YJR4_9FLAO